MTGWLGCSDEGKYNHLCPRLGSGLGAELDNKSWSVVVDMHINPKVKLATQCIAEVVFGLRLWPKSVCNRHIQCKF